MVFATSTHSYWFTLSNCILCNAKFESFRTVLKPPTAGLRILSIDGGGVRGIIPLQILRELEQVLALPNRVQEHFDIALGTSSGGLIVLGLFLNGWSVVQALEIFTRLSSVAFTPRQRYFPKYFGLLLSYLADSRYNSSSFESALKAVFGDTRTMREWSELSIPGKHVAVTTTRVTDSSSVLFANYPGGVRRSY